MMSNFNLNSGKLTRSRQQSLEYPWRKYRIKIHSESIRIIPIYSDICIRANALMNNGQKSIRLNPINSETSIRMNQNQSETKFSIQINQNQSELFRPWIDSD